MELEIKIFGPGDLHCNLWASQRTFLRLLPGNLLTLLFAIYIFNCSRKIVSFMQNFCLAVLTFRVTFTPLTFCVLPDLKSQPQFQAAELNWRQFNTQSQMRSAQKLVPFFTLNLNSGIC